MSEASRRARTGQQINFTLDPHWRLVLRLAAEADGMSVPDLIRPVVMRYLRSRMRNEDLREAVARIEQVKRSRRGVPDNITRIPRALSSRNKRRTGDSKSRSTPEGSG
jgi:hypothetical protein